MKEPRSRPFSIGGLAARSAQPAETTRPREEPGKAGRFTANAKPIPRVSPLTAKKTRAADPPLRRIGFEGQHGLLFRLLDEDPADFLGLVLPSANSAERHLIEYTGGLRFDNNSIPHRACLGDREFDPDPAARVLLGGLGRGGLSTGHEHQERKGRPARPFQKNDAEGA